MAHPDYNRRGYSPVAPSVYTANSNDYTSGYGTQQDTYNPLNRPAGGPKPLDWHVGGATAPNAQGPSRSSEPAYWSTTSTGPGALNTNYNYAATGSDTATTADAAFSARSYPQKQQSGAASAGPIPAYAGTRLGPEIAGYKSVLTKNPVSPSGYSLAAPPQQQPSPAGKQRSSTSAISHNPQHSQQPRTPAATQEVDPAKRSAAAAVAALAALGSNRTKSPDKSAGSTGSNISRPSSIRYGSPAGGGYANTTNIDSYSNGASDGYPAEDMYGYAGRGGYPAASAAEGPAALQWKLPAGAGSGTFTPPAAHSPVAGRRAAAAPANAGSYAPSSNRSTNEDTLEGYIPSNAPGLRPPSQQRTEGLSKLKQLASARMACRISTPPTEDLIHPAAPATAPTVGRRSSGGYGAAARAPVQADRGALDLQQQRQQHQQRDPWQHSQDYNPSTYTDYQYQPAASNAAPSSGRRSAVRQAVTARSRMPPQLQQNGEVEDTPMRAAGGARAFGGYNLDAALAADGSAPLQGDTASEQCPSCGRKFTATAFDRHVGICDKVFGQKRKAFNVQAQRLAPEAAKFVGKVSQQQQGAGAKATSSKQLDSRPAKSAAESKKAKWQAQSNQLRAAMRAGPGSSQSGGGFGGGPGAAPAYEEPDDRVLCPHCGRKFAEFTAERHIPKCSEIIAKPKELKAGGGTGAYMRNKPPPRRGR